MSTHKPPPRTHRNYRADARNSNDQRQPSQSHAYHKKHQEDAYMNMHSTNNSNNRSYSYIINQHPPPMNDANTNEHLDEYAHPYPHGGSGSLVPHHQNTDAFAPHGHHSHTHASQQSDDILLSPHSHSPRINHTVHHSPSPHQHRAQQHHHHHHRAHSGPFPHHRQNGNDSNNNNNSNAHRQHHHNHHSYNNHGYNSQRKTRHYHHNNDAYQHQHPHHRNRHGFNGQHTHHRQHGNNNHSHSNSNNDQYLSQYQNYNQHHNPRPSSHPPISSDILICIDTVGPELIQFLPASTAYYLIEVIEPYLTNQNNAKDNGVPIRRKSELLSKWHNSYVSWKRMNEYLDINDLLQRLSHFNHIHKLNSELNSNLCIWDITIKKSEIEQLFGAKRNVMIRAVLSYIVMESFLMNKHNLWFPPKSNGYMLIKKQLNLRDIHKFLLSKLQKIDDIKKFYNINPNLMKEKLMNCASAQNINHDAPSSSDAIHGDEQQQHAMHMDTEYLSNLLSEFKSRFERDNCGGDTLLYCQSWECDKFENILPIASQKYPMEKHKKRAKKSHIYELGYRSRLDKPIFGFYLGKHRGYNPRTKGIEVKFNPQKSYSYFYDLKLLFLPEFIEDCINRYFSFDVKWESDYTRGEQFKYYNVIAANLNCKSINDMYHRFKFLVWKGQYFDADDNLLGQYSG